MLCVTHVFAQNRTVTGTVTAKDDGLPIPGVSVKIKGTSLGVQTGTNGKYTISVPANGVLVFSFIGYAAQEKAVGGSSVIDIVLNPSAQQLSEVVVTGALGIKKADKEVGYATTLISGNDANEAKPIDPINGLTGKVAGLVIQQTNEGMDPTIKVDLRGFRSALGNNDALFVVDGSPVPSAVVENLNADDIESYNVLNGSGAAALYGSQASNGAIVITTKKGTSGGKPVISYNNSITLSQVANLPKLQGNYGQYGGEGPPYVNPLTAEPYMVPFENQNYGMPFNGSIQNVGVPANATDGPQLTAVYSAQKTLPAAAFFNTGVNEQNSMSFRQGDAANYFGLSARNVNQTGIVPMDQGMITNVRATGGKTYGIFRLEYSADYTKQTISEFGENPDGSNLYSNLLQFPANLNIKSFQNVNDPTSFASENNYFSAYSWNPYWALEDSRNNISRDQVQGFINAILSPTKWLDISYRVDDNFGVYRNKFTRDAITWSAYAQTYPEGPYGGVNEAYFNPVVKGAEADYLGYGDGSGSIINGSGDTPNWYGDNGLSRLEGTALISFHKQLGDFKTSAYVGNTIFSENANYTYDSSSSLILPGYNNVNAISGSPNLQEATGVIRQVSFFGDLALTYKGFLTLEGTERNDRDSRLSPANQSYYFPSVKAAFIPTEAFTALKDNSVLDYWKLYADISQVGQVSIPPYEIQQPQYNVTNGFPYGSLAGFSLNTTEYSPNLKPEIVNEQEFGTEIGLFKDRIHLNFDYYYQKDKNQTLDISLSPSTGYTSEVINAGEIDSYGEEMSLQAIVFPKGPNSVGWTVGGNFSVNESKVVSLLPGVDKLQIGTQFDTNGGAIGGSYAVVGQAFPQLYVTDYNRDPKGQVIVNGTDGLPSTNPSPVDEGRTTPKYNLGVNTTLSYKIVTLNIVADYRGGDVIYNSIGSFMDFAGSSAQSASAGRSIFIYPNSAIQTGTNTYATNTTIPVAKGGWEYWSTYPVNVGSPYVSSAAFWRIREVSLAFNLTQYIKHTGFIKGLTFALTGRNLFLFLPKSEQWGDPELSNAGTGSNALGGNDTNNMPSSRIYGADLNVTF